MKLEPKYYVLEELLERRLFRIPNYQRAYSWETRQRTDLFGDIKKLLDMPDERHHFMAAIVCLNKNIKEQVGADEFATLEVVDGQQRLTTLIILLKAIEKQLKSKKATDADLKARVSKLLVKADKRLILLQTNHDSRKIFVNYLREGTLPKNQDLSMDAEFNLFDAFVECESFVAQWAADHGDLIKLLSILKNRIGFIFYILDDESSVYTVFEVLNSRGLEVDWLDKCKSALMGIVYEGYKPNVAIEHQNELHTIWSQIYLTLGKKAVPGHEVLRFAGTLKQEDEQSKPLSATAALDYFKEYCTKKPIRTIEVSKFLLIVATELRKLYENPRLEAVSEIAQARLLAIAILQSGSLKADQKNAVLDEWERVTFKIFGLSGKDSRTGVGDYVRTAHKIYNGKLKTKADIIAEIKAISEPYAIKQAIPGLRKADCYNGWESSLRYFLYRYEEYLCQKEGGSLSTEIWEQIWHKSPTTSIEHIHPQTRTVAWQGKLGKGGRSLEANVHRLGNLLLLPPGVNSQAGQKSFADKKEIYKKNFLRMHAEILACSDWNKTTIDEREERLLEWAENTWHD